MTDRELLTMAAKAAGIAIYFDDDGDCYRIKASENRAYWDPLHFDGDALRLAVRLKLRLSTVCNNGNASVASATDMYLDVHVEEHNGDPYAATRRAIVRAAAEIGRAA